jgi:hypothetical protein
MNILIRDSTFCNFTSVWEKKNIIENHTAKVLKLTKMWAGVIKNNKIGTHTDEIEYLSRK